MPKITNYSGTVINNDLVVSDELPGLMCCERKSKLDSIEEGANKTVVDDALSDSSVNPVQNKVVTEAINNILSSSDVFVINLTAISAEIIESEIQIQMDKTFDEITAAYNENKVIIAVGQIGTMGEIAVYYLSQYTDSVLSFNNIYSTCIINVLYINDDNTIEYYSSADDLETDDKTITGAINELNEGLNNITDTNVTNTLDTTAKAYVTGTTSEETNTGTQVFDTGVYLSETEGQLVADTFKGDLVGNSSTADTLKTISLATNSANRSVYYNPFTWEFKSAWAGMTGIYAITDTDGVFCGIFGVKARVGTTVDALASYKVYWLSAIHSYTTPTLTLTAEIGESSTIFRLYITPNGTYKVYKITRLSEVSAVTPVISTNYVTSMEGTVYSTADSVSAGNSTKIGSATIAYDSSVNALKVSFD